MIPRERVPVVAEGDELIDAAGELAENELNRALVLDGERLVGLLSVTDVARVLELRGAGRRRLAGRT
jgi:CBS domain-containing protein